VGKYLNKLRDAIVKAGKLGALDDPITVEANMPELEEVLGKLEDVFGDGFQWSDISLFIGEVVPEFMDVANKFKEETGEQKKQFVIDAVVATYFYYDPDLPWIPEWIETKLEKWAVPQIAAAAIEAAYKIGKKRGYWDDELAGSNVISDPSSVGIDIPDTGPVVITGGTFEAPTPEPTPEPEPTDPVDPAKPTD
jgi:hypothetical protein